MNLLTTFLSRQFTKTFKKTRCKLEKMLNKYSRALAHAFHLSSTTNNHRSLRRVVVAMCRSWVNLTQDQVEARTVDSMGQVVG